MLHSAVSNSLHPEPGHESESLGNGIYDMATNFSRGVQRLQVLYIVYTCTDQTDWTWRVQYGFKNHTAPDP